MADSRMVHCIQFVFFRNRISGRVNHLELVERKPKTCMVGF